MQISGIQFNEIKRTRNITFNVPLKMWDTQVFIQFCSTIQKKCVGLTRSLIWAWIPYFIALNQKLTNLFFGLKPGSRPARRWPSNISPSCTATSEERRTSGNGLKKYLELLKVKFLDQKRAIIVKKQNNLLIFWIPTYVFLQNLIVFFHEQLNKH